MTSSTHWPKHFFLISGNNTDHHFNHKPSRESMGTKAYNLLRMAEIGLQVPPALVIGTDFSHHPEECFKPLFDIGLPALQNVAGEVFGDIRNPLIVSVRSGASVSMPGMMETILNVGISDATLSGFCVRLATRAWCGTRIVIWSPAMARLYPVSRRHYLKMRLPSSPKDATSANWISVNYAH